MGAFGDFLVAESSGDERHDLSLSGDSPADRPGHSRGPSTFLSWFPVRMTISPVDLLEVPAVDHDLGVAVADKVLEVQVLALQSGQRCRTTSTSVMTGIEAPVSTTSMRSSARNNATPAITTA